MSDTPRTDAAARLVRTTGNGVLVHANFARELEREKAALRKDYRKLAATISDIQQECSKEVSAAKIKLEITKRENAALRKALVETQRYLRDDLARARDTGERTINVGMIEARLQDVNFLSNKEAQP